MSGQVSRGSAGEYQADERAGVARSVIGDGLLKGEQLITCHPEPRGVKLSLIVIPSVSLEVPEDHALNVRFLLVEEEAEHLEVVVTFGDRPAAGERIGEDADQMEAVLVAESADGIGLFFSGLILQALLIAFGVAAIGDYLVAGTERRYV